MITKKSLNILKQIQIIPDKKKKLNIIIIKIVTKNQTYYQNITINAIKSMLPTYFKISAKGTLINMRNIHKIDWNEMIVFFKDGTKDYVVTNSHKKEIENYEAD